MEEARQLLGGQCVDCGATENLEIDHINWKDKSIQLNKLWSIAKSRFLEELKKCCLRCKPCHIEKSKKDLAEIIDSRPEWGINIKYL